MTEAAALCRPLRRQPTNPTNPTLPAEIGGMSGKSGMSGGRTRKRTPTFGTVRASR